jgi:tetratricopeptide (TPR) repeat protein
MNKLDKMNKFAFTLVLAICILPCSIFAQIKPDNPRIDIMLIEGDYKKVIDTCQLILSSDSLNSEIYYKMGLAYQNLIQDDKSFECFYHASKISPGNNNYSFMVAKYYYNKGKPNLAKPILVKLCATDSMNWVYSFYLTSILMQETRYDESLEIYKRFYENDTLNYLFLDKIGFAYLRKGNYDTSKKYFNRSLAINNRNVTSLKNIAWLWAVTYKIDTAIQILTRAINLDPADMDLYVRRASMNYSKNYTKRALDDYLKVLGSGDSSFLYLKRIGVGYTNNFQPNEAVEFLLKAYNKDSSDYEVSNYLAQNYQKLNDLKKSAYYYRHIIKTINPVMQQLRMTDYLLAEVLKSDGLYEEAITYYLLGQQFRSESNITLIIANLYDEKLKDIPKAIHYYELFLENTKNIKPNTSYAEYVDSIRKRLDYLKNPKTSSIK